MDFVSLSSSPHDDICVCWTREKTMTKSAKLLAYRTGVRPSPFFSSFTVECVSWYCRKANTFGKTKAILFLLWSIWFCREIFGFAVRFLVFPWCFCFCREVFGFAVTVVGHHSFVLAVAWSTEKKGKKQFCRALCTDLRDVRTDDVIMCDAHSQQNWQTTGGRCPRWLKKTYFWQLHQMRFGILFIQKTGIKRKLHRSVY